VGTRWNSMQFHLVPTGQQAHFHCHLVPKVRPKPTRSVRHTADKCSCNYRHNFNFPSRVRTRLTKPNPHVSRAVRFKNSVSYPHSVTTFFFLCFSQLIDFDTFYGINRLAFVMKVNCVILEMWTEGVHKTHINVITPMLFHIFRVLVSATQYSCWNESFCRICYLQIAIRCCYLFA
jgi:hypothetical protein